VAYRRTPAIQDRLDAQRDAVLAAAVELLAEVGYAGCSVNAVAARAGIAVGSVYSHFGSKAALVVEVFRLVAGREVEAVRSAAGGVPCVADAVRAYIETFAGRAFKSPLLAYALLAEPVDAAVDAQRFEFRLAFRDVLAGIVVEGVASGMLPPQNATAVAAALVGAIGEVLVGPLVLGVTDPETVPTLVQFALRALGVPDAVDA